MGAVAGGMTNVVDMMFDNWRMAFQLTEGAKHADQSPSGYNGLRAMRGFDDKGKVLKPVPQDALFFTGRHIDHELVENIEVDCGDRISRMKAKEPRRFLVTMGGAGAQHELFKVIIEHAVPMIEKDRIALFIDLGDHKDNWIWLQEQLAQYKDLINTHFTWEDPKEFTDSIRKKPAHGLHIFLHDNTFHAVYATNYLMRVMDVMITEPSELTFYPVLEIFNARVADMKCGPQSVAQRSATALSKPAPSRKSCKPSISSPKPMTLAMFCNCIGKNKSIGIYDRAYKSVELATGIKFTR